MSRIETQFTTYQEENRKPIVRKDILGDNCFLLYNLLSPKECQYYIDQTEELKYDPIDYAKNYRVNDRIMIKTKDMSELIWERIKPYVANIDRYSKKQKITWTPYGCNNLFRFCRYYPGGFFKGHSDGNYIKNLNQKSLKTCNVYLNSGFEGGRTLFLDEITKEITHEVVPETGMALIFDHEIFHCGEELKSDKKYLMRTDIMFENYNNKILEDQKKIEDAMEFYHLAAEYEAEKKMEKAVEFYQKAFKCYPEIETMLN